MNEMSFNNYDIKIAQSGQQNEIINMVKESYNKSSTGWIGRLFGSPTPSASLAKSIENGRCFIVTKKTNGEIVACTVIDDYVDHKYHVVDSFDRDDHMGELSADQSRKMYEFIVNKLGSEAKLKYGTCVYQCCSCTKHGLSNTAFSFIFSLISYFAGRHHVGYKMLVIFVSNAKMVNAAKAFGTGVEIIHETDYSNYKFKDGTNMDQYFDELKLKNPHIDIEKFKKKCKVAAIYTSRPSIGMDTYKILAKMVKAKRDKRSKL
eukprot:71416_1